VALTTVASAAPAAVPAAGGATPYNDTSQRRGEDHREALYGR